MSKKKFEADIKGLPDNHEERKKFYKMLLTPMSFEDKIDELGPELSNEDLAFLLEQFKEDEDYEICQAFQYVLNNRKSSNR